MNRLQRQRQVVIIWAISIALAIIGGVIGSMMSTTAGGIVASANRGVAIWFVITPILVASLWTLWGIFNHRQSKQDAQHQQETISPQNAPMPYKMALLLEMMDEDEREALKQDLRRQILADENHSEMFSRLMVEETEKRKRG